MLDRAILPPIASFMLLVPLLLLLLGATACTIEEGALGAVDAGPRGPDAALPGDGPADDGSRGPLDGGADARMAGDAGIGGPCLPISERCNGRDDDCDGRADEEVCSGCMVVDISEAPHVFCVDATDWSDARRWCRDQGLDLMVVDDLDEDRQAHEQARILRARGWWIGLDDRATEGTYVWVDGRIAWDDGTARTFTNFAGGRPQERPPEDCVQTDGSRAVGTWLEARCDAPAPFVCEGPRVGGEEPRPKTPDPDLDP